MATTPRGKKWRTEFMLDGVRYLHTSATKDEGEAWEAYVRLQVRQGNLTAVEKVTKAMTLGEAFTEACKVWAGSRNELNAVANARDVLDFLGADTKVRDLSKTDMLSLVEYLRNRKHRGSGNGVAQPLSNATVNRKLAALSKMLSVARDRGEPVTIRVPMLKEAEGRLRFLTDDEEAKVLKAMRDHKGEAMRDFVGFALETGGRLSENLGLKVKHFAKRGDVWFLTYPASLTKSKKSRTIPLTAKALDYLKDRLNGNPEDRIWPADWNKYTVTHAWALVRRKIGLQHDEEFVFHVCRHTCATRLLETTGNLKLVKEWLGHSDTRTTERYAKVVPTTLLTAVNGLNLRSTRETTGGAPVGGLGGNLRAAGGETGGIFSYQ